MLINPPCERRRHHALNPSSKKKAAPLLVAVFFLLHTERRIFLAGTSSTPYFLVVKSVSCSEGLYPPSLALSQVHASKAGHVNTT